MDNLCLYHTMPRIHRILKEHRELFGQIKHLLESCIKINGLHTVSALFKYRRDHLEAHFRREEALMGNEYPDAAAHKLTHLALQQAFDMLMVEFEQVGATQQMVSGVALSVLEMLIEHEQTQDMLLEKYLLEKNFDAQDAS